MSAQTKRTRRTVLIVGDDPPLQKIMSDHVALMNIDVVTASHYAAALTQLVSRTPDLVCVDIELPTQSGFELCEYIRGSLWFGFLPIILTSACGWPEEMAFAEEAGADVFLLKPFSLAELGANIAELLRGRSGTPHARERNRHG